MLNIQEKLIKITPKNINSQKTVFVLIISFLVSLSQFQSAVVFAQDDAKKPSEVQSNFDENDPAYRVLGRKLTQKEIASLSGVKTTEEIIAQEFLHDEDLLVKVRAISFFGVNPSSDLIAELYFDKQMKFIEMVNYLHNLEQRYGSIEKGLENIRSASGNENKILEDKIELAYEEVTGASIVNDFGSNALSQYVKYFKTKGIDNYDDIVNEFVTNVLEADAEEKKSVMKLAMKDAGFTQERVNNLMGNKRFIDSVMNQRFTHHSLVTLFHNLK